MTVCIAGIAGTGRKSSRIVTATDQQVQLGQHFAGENLLLKNEPIHISWNVMTSGSDVTVARPIIDGVRKDLGFSLPVFSRTEAPSVEEVREALEKNYQLERRRLIKGSYLSSFDMNLEDFKTNGKNAFPENTYREMWKRIDECDIGCELLVSGFDLHGYPHILAIDHPGVVREYSEIGFWAIGSGQYQALSVLSFLRKRGSKSLKATLYQVCAAKFFSETEPTVGKETLSLLYEPGHAGEPVDWKTLETMRGLWESHSPSLPSDIEKVHVKTDTAVKRKYKKIIKRATQRAKPPTSGTSEQVQ